MICDYVHVIEANIYGIKSPKFVIKGSVMKDNSSFKILGDGKVLQYNSLPLYSHFGFLLEALIPKEIKKIEVYVINNNKEELICTRTNSLYHRVKSKFRKIIEKPLNKMKLFFKTIFKLITLLFKGIKILWKKHHFLVPPTLWKKYFVELCIKVRGIFYNGLYLNPMTQKDYMLWLEKQSNRDEKIKNFSYNPKISIVIPVYNVNRQLLSECIDSILKQTYTNFEICLADDKSTNQETIDTLKEYERNDKRIKVVYRKENGHISKATNSAIKIATGEFIALMDNDDVLSLNALYEVVKFLNKNKKLDMIYSDEDKLDMNGNFRDPHFKSDFAPDTLLSSNYICHFCVLRKSIVDEIGGFRVGYEGSQDHDLFLRFTEKTTNIAHIPKILYHWRMIPGSTAATINSKSYALERGKKAVEDALKRRKIKGNVSIKYDHYVIEYTYDKEPSISIIIPTKNHADDTEICLKSIFEKTNYKNYEVVLVNNDSNEKALFNLIDKYKNKYKNFRVVDANMPFNYSKINNIAVETCKSDYIVLLNNDTELITNDWLKIMVGYAMQKHIGTVGVKLLYTDNTVQHAGVVLGVGGIANHAFIGEKADSIGLYARLVLPHNYSANTAACLMISRDKYNEVGGLEEELMVAYNDIDLNLKLLQKGYYNIFVPQVELYHYESKSRGLDTTKEKYKRFMKEQYYMYDKWKKIIDNDPFYNTNFSKTHTFLLDKVRKEKYEENKISYDKL